MNCQDMDGLEAEKFNQKYWDELAHVHYRAYDLKGLRDGGISLDEIQVKEVGDVRGKSMLHLQCHIGHDTLSWARLGAQVTGIDFSGESIKVAETLRAELGLNAGFIQSNVYDLPELLNGSFDIVYTSQGVLCWLRDLTRWSEIVSGFVKPGGFFYIMDGHPFSMIFDNDKSGPLEVRYSYFGEGCPARWEGGSDYASSYQSETPTFEWTWGMGDVINALIASGLRIDFVHEFDRLFYKGFPNMVKDEEGWWYLPEYRTPLSFSLKATKDFT